jgi:hypothetical protein
VLTSTTFIGIDIAINRKATFLTRTQENVSGKETRVSLRTIARYTWDMKFNFLRASVSTSLEFSNFAALFNTVGGSFDTFQWLDPEDNVTALSTLSFVSSAPSVFQLQRAVGNSTTYDPIYAPSTAALLVFAVNSSGQSSASTIGVTVNYWGSSAPGTILPSTFSPGSSASLVTTFSYYWPVRWDSDDLQLDRFGFGWYEIKKMSFTSVI